jgi:hypothetical protein
LRNAMIGTFPSFRPVKRRPMKALYRFKN